MTAPVYACVRCGIAEREEDTFLCGHCLDLHERTVELRDAEIQFPGDHKAQRRHLTNVYGWQGWNRRMSRA